MKKLVLVIGFALLVGACASITQGTSQTLIFDIDPMNTRCDITRSGDGNLGSVSGRRNSIEVAKDKDDIVVVCNAPGYRQLTQRIVSSASVAGVTGVLIDLGITDMITGAMYQYPKRININLEKN